MVSKRIYAVPLIICILLLIASPQIANATIVDNTYNFAGVWFEQTSQYDNGPIYVSKREGQFKLTILNVTQMGGSDVIVYNYAGFDSRSVVRDINDTVDFQDNKVYFDLTTYDTDNNSRSEFASLAVYPYIDYRSPGHFIFVNPVWSTHVTGWDAAVADVEDNPIVSSSQFTASEGSFTLNIVVDAEANFTVGTQLQPGNGTYTYTFSASYDSDGVLSSYQRTYKMHMQNENSTLDYTTSTSVLRTSGSGPSASVLDLSAGIPLLYVGIIIPVVLVIGLLIGRKLWA